jgi:hypothetical protein
VGSILRIIFDALYWSREKTEGGVLRPLLIVMEEAHRYLADSSENAAAQIVKRVAKEGRKYGVGAMIVSQRPSEVDETILSQCGTTIAMRLTNPSDRMRVKAALPDNLAGLMDLLPVLRTGEAIITGEAARLPVRCRVAAPTEKHQPRSADPKVTEAWSVLRTPEGYDRMIASWRGQRTTAVVMIGGKMDRQNVASSTIASIGYEQQTETLEVEFLNGNIYQYYNVPPALFAEFQAAPSKGQFLNTMIRNAYAFSRVG